MRTIGPSTLGVGAVNVVNDPAQAGGNPSVACQIQNSSPYQLSVLAEGDTLSIQPFTAQTIEISGQPIQVTPLAGGSTAACTVTFVFLLGVQGGQGVMLPDGTWVETPPQQDGPLTAAAIASALSTQGSVDLLGSGNAGPLLANTVLTLGAFTALHAYSTLLVYIVNNSNANCPVLFVGAVNTTVFPPIGVFIGYESQASPMEVRPFSASPVVNFLLPFAAQAGNTLEVQVTSPITINSISYLVFGLTSTLAVQVTAPLGNPLGVSERGGLSVAKVTTVVGNAAVLAAPAAGTAYRLHRFVAFNGPAAPGAWLLGLVTNSVYSALLNTAQVDNLFGQVVTEGLQLNSGTAGILTTLTYDTIPTPAIS